MLLACCYNDVTLSLCCPHAGKLFNMLNYFYNMRYACILESMKLGFIYVMRLQVISFVEAIVLRTRLWTVRKTVPLETDVNLHTREFYFVISCLFLSKLINPTLLEVASCFRS